ncbi:heavy metal translocating P-type ATPase [Rhodohalobacter halophilus]|uniref:heavy metal translocating P-type ATPase n=1 Tax=Rhodohalobacter halophilus TaxID=1812810 RepID=UPI00083F5544|nr:heavy metal translocating P-type ATPase [Rhodohalobacter halophilus]
MSHQHEAACSCDSEINFEQPTNSDGPIIEIKTHLKPILSFLLLMTGLGLDYLVQPSWFSSPIRFIWYTAAYLPVGLPVILQAWRVLKKGDLFSEFFLMSIATFGAFYIGEYPEGVAVMLFYSVGEAFQDGAVNRAKSNIKALLDVRSETARVYRNGEFTEVHPETVISGEIIQILPGERIPLDGEIVEGHSTFDTSALTGESLPRTYQQGEKALAGMVNLNRVIQLRVTSSYENSSIARILNMVQDAAGRKAKTELFIRKFAKVYTPIVVLLASLLVALPALFVSPYVFDEWLYRGLVFLVISCPCALVISIPLGYFGGIGAASRNGILVKGANYLDALRNVETVVFDKTGTLTKGRFSVESVDVHLPDRQTVLDTLYALEMGSNHPLAKALTDHISEDVLASPEISHQQEHSGMGVSAKADGKLLLAGNRTFMEKHQVLMNGHQIEVNGSVIYFAIDGKAAATVTFSDQIKEDAAEAIQQLRKLGVKQTVMLSGDKKEIAENVGNSLGLDAVYGELLPDEKAAKLEEIKQKYGGVTAYAGDGINDAPVLALSDVGIAMGAMGSDVAVETADVVIQTDQPGRIATAIRISRATRNIVWQNIGLAMGVKIAVLGLGALGMASLWEAVFADVGVALLAILNAIRIQQMKFE